MTVGAFASATGMGLLAMAVALHGLPIFLLATAMAGAGYSLLFLSAPNDTKCARARDFAASDAYGDGQMIPSARARDFAASARFISSGS